MSTKLAVQHVLRPELPWRPSQAALTECKLTAASYPTIDRDELWRRIKEWGEQRTAMTVCMTCYDTARRWSTWEIDPLDALQRAINQEPRHYSSRMHHKREKERGSVPLSSLRLELRAIMMLINAHREEFDGLLKGLSSVTYLDQVRVQEKNGWN